MPLLDNFEGWLDKMLVTAQGAAETNQKRRMEQLKYGYDKQYGVAATPYGPAYKGVEATQAGETKRTGMTQAGETERQNIVTGEGKRQFDLTNPSGYLKARGEIKTADLLRPGRERQAENFAENVFGQEKVAGAKAILDKHMTATSTMGEVQPNWWDFISMRKGSSPITEERQDYALAKRGLSRKNLLGPEQLNAMINELKGMGLDKQKKKMVYPEDY